MIVTIIRKELSMLFISPLAWILLALIQLILTWVFLVRLDAFLEIQSQLMQIANPRELRKSLFLFLQWLPLFY